MLCPWFLRRLCVASFPVAPITQCSAEETLPAGLPWETNTGKIHWLPCRTSTFLLCCSASQSCSTFATPWTASCQASLSFTIFQSLLKLMPIESLMPSSLLILCHPLLLLPSIFPSIRVFSNESVLCIRWPKYWSFSFNISPSNEYSGLIFFRMDWLDLLEVQGTLRLFSNNIVQKHQFFGAQLSSQSNSYIHSWPLEKP